MRKRACCRVMTSPMNMMCLPASLVSAGVASKGSVKGQPAGRTNVSASGLVSASSNGPVHVDSWNIAEEYAHGRITSSSISLKPAGGVSACCSQQAVGNDSRKTHTLSSQRIQGDGPASATLAVFDCQARHTCTDGPRLL